MTSTSTPTIRQLGTADWRQLKELRLAALAEAPHAFLSLPGETTHRPDDWRLRLDPDVCIWFGAFTEDGPCGLIGLVRNPESGERYAESMWVAPAQRGTGIAAWLLAEAQAFVLAEGGTVLNLWVLDSNPASRGFYLHHGFVATGTWQPIHGRREEQFRIELPAAGRLAPVGSATPARGGSSPAAASRHSG